MKVFISWSGPRSKAVAELLSDWIKCVLQASQPWISTRDIDKGAIWFSEISNQLKDTAAGIVCLTQENKNKPWILFEAGALAKGISTNRVCTFLIDLDSSDVEDPLAQFNHTTPDESSLWGLVCSLNACLESNRLDERILRKVFDTYWPLFNEGFKAALEQNPAQVNAEPRSEQSILAEILGNTRSLAGRVREIEQRVLGKNDGGVNLQPYTQIKRMAENPHIPIQEIIKAAGELRVPHEEVVELLNQYRVLSNVGQERGRDMGKVDKKKPLWGNQ